MLIRLGTRKSDLARIQAKIVAQLIVAASPDCEILFVPLSSIGDKDRQSGFHVFGGIGAFTKESEQELIDKRVDIVVHSLKDLPTKTPQELVLAAVPERLDPRDVLCGVRLADLRPGMRIGSGSIRRQAQLLSICRELVIKPIRGNVPPRLRKAKNKEGIDATVLAAAGLMRLGMMGDNMEILDSEVFPYAVGQGALGIQARRADDQLLEVLSRIEDRRARAEVDAERALMLRLEAGCNLPIGVMTSWSGDDLMLQAQVTRPDGSEKVFGRVKGSRANATTLGEEVGELLIAQGARSILAGL